MVSILLNYVMEQNNEATMKLTALRPHLLAMTSTPVVMER